MDPEQEAGGVESPPVYWSSLLDMASRAGIPHRKFWRMTLREFLAEVDARTRDHREREEAEWMRTAVHTTYIYNVVGSAWYKGFKPMKAGDLFDIWTGKEKPEDVFAAERFEAAHEELLNRDKWQ